MKIVAILAVLGLVLTACVGSDSSQVNTPSTSTLQQSPTPPANINPTSTPVPSPAAQTTSTATPAPAITAETETGGVAEDGDSIAIHYTGTLDNGDVFDTSRDGDPPLEFVLGAGQMIPGFENAVRGMAVGEMKTVHLNPDEAYGEPDDNLILELPREGAPDGLSVGDTVRLSNGIPVTIVEITDDVVIIDANHRLAGEALTFEIEVVGIN